MAISRTPKRDSELFSAPTAQIFDDIDDEDNKQKETDRIVELEQALKDLRAKQEEERSDALLSQPSQWQSQVNQPTYTEVKVDTVALPDPALDPEGYDAALAQRNEIRESNRRNKENADRRRDDDIKEKTDTLWADFGEEYPEYVEGPEGKTRLNFIATEVVQAAVKRGLDVQRYMFGTGRSRFMKDLTKRYNKVFGEPETDEDNEDNSDRRSTKARDLSSRRNANRNRQEDDEGRSAGVFGGNEGGRSTSRRNVDVEEGPSMIDDLHAIQRKTGFY